jgi:hypothetical protein
MEAKQKQTPMERAESALKNQSAFCNLLAEARQCGFSKRWEGSAFRNHPCGIVSGTIKMTNHWHVSDDCDIAITDGDGWNLDVCRDSFAYGNPHPQPINGTAIMVWSCGRWKSPEYELALKERVLAILVAAAEHIDRVHTAKAEKAAQEAEERRQQFKAAEAAALAKAAT